VTGQALPGLKTISCPPAQLLGAACRQIASTYAGSAPDLTRLTIVVPDLHAVVAVVQALRDTFARPVLLLPRIVTLRSWSSEIALDQDVTTAVAQESVLYRLLAERGWLAGADLWMAATELAALFAELTRWRVALPASRDDLKARLEAAYRAKAGVSFGFEARLIHELWHASHSGGAIDAESAYVLQLERLVHLLNTPICALGLTRLAPAETEFFQRAALRVAVDLYQADPAAGGQPIERAIAQTWPTTARVDLPVRANELRAAIPISPFRGRLRFFAAQSAEQQARAVDVAIRQWLLRGRKNIAVVVFDRVIARRARALLERAEVLVRDEAGWTLSTTSAATVVGRWLDAVSSDFTHGDFLDFLKSPFAFHDWPRHERQQTVWGLEQALRGANVRSGISRYVRLAQDCKDQRLQTLLSRVVRAEQLLARSRPKTIHGWLHALGESLAELGVREGLAADAAGAELLKLLDMLGAELEADVLRLGFGEWRRWLARKLEAATFRDRSIESPVIFTNLQATRLRRFDAVLLLGADARHLPGTASAQAFFNQGVRRELGLPVRADEVREAEQLLNAVITACDDVLVTWQSALADEPNLLSPLLERLLTLQGLAWGESLEDATLAAAVELGGLGTHTSELPAKSVRPAPRITSALLPAAVSASSYNALLACPYQFFARYALKLARMDEVEEEIDKADYGEQVHRVLSEFHRAHARVCDLPAQQAQRLLTELSERSFRRLIEHDYQAAAWLARWLALIPQYIEWQRAREAQGFRFVAAEADRSLEIDTPSGRKLLLRGRIDRVDQGIDGDFAVVDYKTRAPERLRKALEVPGEDVQLPVYALLWGGEVAAALFLSIEREGVEPVAVKSEVRALACATRERLGELYDAIADGAPLAAQGSDEVCRYCEMQGLCRKKFWP
jgi:ATP-dependent helicase/nuclease subunit B